MINSDFHNKLFWRKIGVISLFAANFIVFIFIWWGGAKPLLSQGTDSILIAFGRLSGLLAAFFLMTQLMLIGRIRWFEHLYGFDKMNKVHRWIGYSILSLIFAHPILLVWANSILDGVGFFAELGSFLANKEDVLWAFLAILIFCYIVFLSIAGFRRRVKYETWYFIHLANYIAFGLAALHQFNSADLAVGWANYYWYVLNFAVLGLVLVYRFLKPSYLYVKHEFKVQKLVPESHDVTSVYVTGRDMASFKYQAGQYSNLNFLDMKRWWSKHPFSISTAYNGDHIRFSIKNSGDFTQTIPQLKPGTTIFLDGPLGLFIPELATREKLLMIAGGIGITPLRAMIEELTPKQTDIMLLYAIKSSQDMVFKTELENFQKQNPNLKIIYIMSTPEPGFETGFVDKEKVARLVPDFLNREVFLCGPPPMMKAVSKTLMEMGLAKQFIHYEKFSF